MTQSLILCLVAAGILSPSLGATDIASSLLLQAGDNILYPSEATAANFDDALVWAEQESAVAEENDPPVYSEVEVVLEDKATMEAFHDLGLDLDHFHPEVGVNRVLLPKEELQILRDNGVAFKVTVDDMASSIERRNLKYLAANPISDAEKTTAGFELGSMGGFYTYAEAIAQLDEMKALYPNLITDKFSIGTTGEGRTIWAVKISDNPDTDESAAEAPVYFDALHHAREPAAMATVINYMFHLLEGYATDPGLQYIVENREIFVVPVVNPDGYEYNRTTNPGGGGLWRKNRRVNSGSSCRGVDINRNYDTDWAGASSSNPCSNSYHGTAPFSEPEAQAIRDFATSVGAPIAYTTHTSGGFWLGPDFSNNRSDFAIHTELMNDCMQENEYIHGDADIILGYVSGTTQGWLYEELGALTWTPEIGTTGFWPTVPEIIPLVNEQIKPYEYACWVAGALADYQGFTVTSSQGLSSAAPLDFDITIKNKGLTRTAQGVNVVVTADNPGVTAVAGSQSYGNIASRAFATNASSFSFNVDPSVPAGTVVTFSVDVSQDGVVSDSDSFQLTVGTPTVLFSDDAESGSGAWSNGGSGSTWQTSTEDAYTGSSCFVDSRISHASGNRNFTTNSAISLAGTTNPRLEFAAKWSMYQKYTRLQISVNGGGYSNLTASGMGTASGGPAYVGNERWTYQVIDLSSYSGQSVRFRFANFGGGTNPDGFYFDDFRVVDYVTAPTCSDGIQNGNETGVDCGGPDCATCPTCNDGIQNGNETGVDCGGPDCAACPTCNDGVQNGNETGVDCGGPDCAACPTCDDGVQNGNETGVDCGGPDCAACPTCDDGVQNGNETGVDCGGPDCTACPTCSDGVQNGNETGVDCGGPDCAACPTCDDGVQNGNETGVDCGGPDCAACPTCDDGIQNGNETGVDCGGPDCAACPTCDDGVQNGNETGVDCGGPDCAACITCDDGIQNGNETGVDCGGPDCAACPTCDDGIQNGNETGVDCGGPDCAACPTCDDGIQNGNETGVDCGGPDCAACPTCDDGIQNGNETGVDCGGPDCAACPTCDDGIQNGNETGVDCGGPDCAACITCDDGIQNGNETGVDCGGPDCAACPTCDDGVQNGNETGVDCGGPDCAACITCDDGIQNGNETGVDCGGPDCAACPTCDDGIQNGNETGVDCGGPDCAACPTCDDGIQNGNETGVDCGGPDCAACPTCDDGIQNGNETGVDCGGPDCAVCPTCDDGVQNGNETGVDCGGPDCAACPTCDDGIQNGNETGVDCGGPDCAACPTCDDGIQNGNETGVDCGGPDCAVCPTCDDGIQNGNETGVDCGGPDCAACPTCDDGIQNGNETGVDCGGPDCAACPTCDDGIQNGNETGVDCGGPDCAACPTCDDGIQNGSETGVDCGGPDCAACPTCDDGIQNGNETGVDCGGPDCAPCVGCTPVTIISDGFESGYGNWNDGGSDCARVNNSTYAYTGVISARLRDNSSSSRLTSDVLDLSAYDEITVDFTYVPVSMDNANEDFFLELSSNGGSSYTVIEEWNRGDEFENNFRYFETVTITGPFTNNSRLRFRCDASGNSDWVYLDDIIVGSCVGGGGPTCTDGIQNGNETGVDCGGPDCPTCPTCTDGIQNGNETGVDCGGPDCAACITCSDGIQNGNETGVDCGGPDCAACPTCTDGIQNGNETGVDCGGPDCAACITCTDGIQNGNETGVDCGGPDCAACPTCTDGIQNGNETGVDCGGPDCAACPVNYCTSSAGSTQYEHIGSITIAGVTNTTGDDNGYGDYTGTTPIPLSGTVSVSLTPGFAGSSYNEGWVVYIDYNGDGDFTDSGERALELFGSSTVNGTIAIPSGLTGTSQMRIQMRYNSLNGSSCGTFAEGEVEDYTVTFSGGARRLAPMTSTLPFDVAPVLELFPNPARTELTVRISMEEVKEDTPWFIIDATGKVVLEGKTSVETFRSGLNLDLGNLSAGMYYFSLNSTKVRTTKRFIIQP